MRLDDDRGPRPPGARECALVAGASLVLTVALFWAWLRASTTGIPDQAAVGNLGAGADARLIVWILAWDAHAILRQPLRFFDANIFHPAPSMLAGSETLLASALLGAPIYWVTGNAVLAANLLAIASYPLALVATYALLRRLHYGPVASLAAGVAYALGPFRVPADLHVIQYPNWVLPVVLLAAQRAVRGPRGWLVATCAFAFLTSYYMAAMTALVLAIETSLVLVSAGARRALRFATAFLPGLLVLAVLSFPYLRHGRDVALPGGGAESWVQVGIAFQRAYLRPDDPLVGIGWAIALLAIIGLVTPLVVRERRDLRWWRWVLLTAGAYALAAGPLLEVGALRIPLPYSFLLDTPFAALRAFSRFFIGAHLGLVGLAATGIDLLLSLRPLTARPALRGLVAAAMLAWIALPRGSALASLPIGRLEAGGAPSAVYRALARADGPVLEIPGPWRAAGLGRALAQGEFMVASTHHWLPLLNGHTGYPPWWQPLLISEVERLPDPSALRALVNLTGLRWIVVHPEYAGAPAVAAWRKALAKRPDLLRGEEIDGHLLIEVTASPERSWAAALGGAARPAGTTLLGTPRRPIPPDEARAVLRWRFPAPRQVVPPARPLRSAVQVVNQSKTDWPGLLSPSEAGDPSGLVVLDVAWRDERGATVGPVETLPIGRDLIPGDVVEVPLEIATPGSPGRYELVVGVRQVGGATFAGTAALRRWIEVAT
jgi:hypothetical protein